MKTNFHQRSFKQILLLSIVLMIPFLIICMMGLFDSYLLQSFDTKIGSLFYNRGSDLLTKIVIAFTTIGNPITVAILVVIVAGLVLVLKRDWKSTVWYILTVALGAGVLNSLAKTIFQRVRPELSHLIEQDGHSFPSGHVMGSVIYFGALAYLIYYFHQNKSPQIKQSLIGLTVIFVILMGISRLYLGVHYPSDIIGGYSLGSAVLTLAIYYHPRWLQSGEASKC